MSSTLSLNNSRLQEILQTVEGLPDAGSGGNTDIEDGIIMGTIAEINNSRVTSIGESVFKTCKNLISVSFPAAIIVHSEAFYGCTNLKTADFSNVTSAYVSAFRHCTRLKSANFPVLRTVAVNAFESCTYLSKIYFPSVESIYSSAFQNCNNLKAVSFPNCVHISGTAFSDAWRLSSIILGGSSLCTLSKSNAFYNTPYTGYSTYLSGTPYIYVPQSLVSSYQCATNWTYFSSYFSAIENMNPVPIINFTIDGISYQAETGMTWEQWCDSEYNTDGFSTDTDAAADTVVNKDGYEVVQGIKPVFKTAYISANKAYSCS